MPLLLLLTSLVFLLQPQLLLIEGFVLVKRGGGVVVAKAAAAAVSSSNDNDASSSTAAAAAITSSCPFSRAFPRYRIDLTPVISLDNNNNKLFSFWAKARLQSWLPAAARLEWHETENGVTVLASLWRQASNLLTQQQQEEGNIASENNQVVVMMSFPDAQPRVVQHWVDIFSWWNNNNNNQDANGDDKVVYENPFESNYQGRLDVEYVHRENVPSVLFSLSSQSREPGSNISIEDNRSTSWSHKVITKHTQAWVKRILVRQGICPFTKSTKTSGQGLADVGVPVARISYHTSTARHMCTLQADTWEAIHDMLTAGPTAVSSILLAAPHWDDCLNDWTGPVFTMLEAGVVAAAAEADVGVVCFHPQYATPDGSTWPGFGQMHSVPRLETWVRQQEQQQQNDNDSTSSSSSSSLLSTTQIAAGGAWQRRTPHATINVLRAYQLSLAEDKRNSPALYYDNIQKLVCDIGLDQLQHDLDEERRIE